MSAKADVGLVREASRQIMAGGSAGLVEICLMHPLDVVKTRFQIQRSATDPNSYKSLGDSFRMIFRTEGLKEGEAPQAASLQSKAQNLL